MFYVTVRNGQKTGFLVGPFDLHDDALAFVDRAREAAEKIDPFAVFYEFGTARAAFDHPGVLNDRVGFTPKGH